MSSAGRGSDHRPVSSRVRVIPVSQRPDHYCATPTPKPGPGSRAVRRRDAPSPSRSQERWLRGEPAACSAAAAGSVPGSGKPRGGGPGDRPGAPAWRTPGQRGAVRRRRVVRAHATEPEPAPTRCGQNPASACYLPHVTATPRNTARFGPGTRHYRYREMAGCLPACLPASLPLPVTVGLATSGKYRERTLKDFLVLSRRGGKTKRWW